MSTTIQTIYANAELAFASYANLESNIPTELSSNIDALKEAGLSAKQAEEFPARYTEVLTQFTDTETGFSATVFKDAAGNLTLAIRGTESILGLDGLTDASIWTQGAGYDQIVALHNWWLRVSAPAGTLVAQFALTEFPLGFEPAGGVYLDTRSSVDVFGNTLIRNVYLVPAATVLASGQVRPALTADGDGRVDVTGHSLGGHLTMAFGTLFAGQTGAITVFNAPGFTNTAANQQFFAALGGAIPSDVATTNVIADEASVGEAPWNAIAGLHSRPGEVLNIAIEDQFLSDEADPPGARNHSQQILTESLAVYRLLRELDPALSASDYKTLLNAAAMGTAGSYEGVVDALEALFGINTAPLAPGNSQRDALYIALYGLLGNDQFSNLKGRLTIAPVAGSTATAQADTPEGLAYRYALVHLNPFVVTGTDAVTGALYAPHNANGALDLYDPLTGSGALTAAYLADRAHVAARLLRRNSDRALMSPGPLGRDELYLDQHSGTTFYSALPLIPPYPDFLSDYRSYVFGDQTEQSLSGGNVDDRLYGGGGVHVSEDGTGDHQPIEGPVNVETGCLKRAA